MNFSHLLVDGYNIINKWQELLKIASRDMSFARRKLVEDLLHFSDFTGISVRVVFDGNSMDDPNIINEPIVLFSKKGETADAVILRCVYQASNKEKVVVATDDRNVRDMAFGMGARCINSEELKDMLNTQRDSMRRKFTGLKIILLLLIFNFLYLPASVRAADKSIIPDKITCAGVEYDVNKDSGIYKEKYLVDDLNGTGGKEMIIGFQAWRTKDSEPVAALVFGNYADEKFEPMAMRTFSSYFEDIVLADADEDGLNEVFIRSNDKSQNKYLAIYKYKYGKGLFELFSNGARGDFEICKTDSYPSIKIWRAGGLYELYVFDPEQDKFVYSPDRSTSLPMTAELDETLSETDPFVLRQFVFIK